MILIIFKLLKYFQGNGGDVKTFEKCKEKTLAKCCINY